MGIVSIIFISLMGLFYFIGIVDVVVTSERDYAWVGRRLKPLVIRGIRVELL